MRSICGVNVIDMIKSVLTDTEQWTCVLLNAIDVYTAILGPVTNSDNFYWKHYTCFGQINRKWYMWI